MSFLLSVLGVISFFFLMYGMMLWADDYDYGDDGDSWSRLGY